jgi:hypothetical protein
MKQDVLEKTIWPIFLAVFKNTVSVALFNYGKIRALVSMVTLLTMVTAIKQCINYGARCSISMGSVVTR